jgi:hypothetical protein
MTDTDDGPIDEVDMEVLDRVARVHALLDPPPADLDERVRFAIALDSLDIEVARLSEERLVGSGARGSDRTRTITFDCESRTVMVNVVDRADGLVRIDGWLAPPAVLRLELRSVAGAGSLTATSDDTGRFVFDGIAHGLAQLIVHPPDPGGGNKVVTPSLLL